MELIKDLEKDKIQARWDQQIELNQKYCDAKIGGNKPGDTELKIQEYVSFLRRELGIDLNEAGKIIYEIIERMLDNCLKYVKMGETNYGKK